MRTGNQKKMWVSLIMALLLSGTIVGIEHLFHPALEEEFNNDFYEHPDPVDFFPEFNKSSEVYIVDVFPDVENETVSKGQKFTMSCLQGLVNREEARILIDYEGWLHGEEYLEYWDFFMDSYVDHYGLNVTVIRFHEFFELFSSYAQGVVVYDNTNEETINVAATISGINGWIAADKETAGWLKENYGLETKEDLNHGWGGSRADIYEKAFDQYYPSCYQGILFESVPSEWGTDYLVACRGFVFNLNPGPFTTPSERHLTNKIMKETPADIPVIGWFEQPTGMEENYMIQLASRSGKIFLGGFRFPNKSFFSAFEPPGDLNNPVRSEYYDAEGGTGYPDIDPITSSPGNGDSAPTTGNTTSTTGTTPSPPDVGNKIYISLAVTDGDNLGFMTRKMRKEMWPSEIRGTIPIAWSVNPLLREVIPCLLDYYYSSPTENDTFVAGPSGIGYFNPDFCSEDQLDIWLERTANGMEALDLRQVWLLNSFTTYETFYSERVLSAYTGALSPDGIMLDYGDVPEGRKMWMQEGSGEDGSSRNGEDGFSRNGEDGSSTDSAAPVIRSMHIWGDTEGFVGKLIVESQVTPDDQPIFAFAPIMSADLTLKSIPDLLDDLEKSEWALGRDVEFVSIDDLFYLMERSFVERAREIQEEEREERENGGLLEDIFGGSPPNQVQGYDRRMDIISEDTSEERSSDDPSPESIRKLRHLSGYNGYWALESRKREENENMIIWGMGFLFFISLSCLLSLCLPTTMISSRGQKIRFPLLKTDLKDVVRRSLGNTGDGHIFFNGLLLITTTLIFFMTSFHVLYLNFWHYGFFGVGIMGVFVIPIFLLLIDRKWGEEGKKQGNEEEPGRKNGGNHDVERRQKNVGKILALVRDHELLIIGGLLAFSVILLPFMTFAYSLVPYLCIRLFRRIEGMLRDHTIHWILLSFLLVILFSLFLREYSFPVASILLIWFGTGLVGVMDAHRQELKEPSSSSSPSTHVPPPSKNIPAPLFTALLLTLFIAVINIPYNRYLSMATEYRVDLLPWLLLWVPLYGTVIGSLVFQFIRLKEMEKKSVSISALGLVFCSGFLFIQPFVSHSPIIVPLVLVLFGSMLVCGILGLASGNWRWTGRGKRLAGKVEGMFYEVLIILLTLALVIVTMPPIAFTVYVMSVPIVIAYILYSLPAVLLLISAVMAVLSRQITLQSKPLLEP